MKDGEILHYTGIGSSDAGSKQNVTYKVMGGSLTVYQVDSVDWEGRKGQAGTSHFRPDPAQLPRQPIRLKKKYRRNA